MSNSVVDTNYAYLSYNDVSILSQRPYRLTLSIEELTKPAVKNCGDFEKPPRPQNSWIIFRRDYEAHLRLFNQHVKKEVKKTAHECSMKWKNLPSEVKQFFKILEKIAYENHKSLYPNYKYKPRNIKDLNIKKWVFRGQRKYAFTSSPMSASMNNNFPSQEATQLRSSSLNDTTSITEYNRTVITTSTTNIDDTHLLMINTNNKAENSINEFSSDQLSFLFKNEVINNNLNANIHETLFSESFMNDHNNVSINNDNSLPLNQFTTNNLITPLILSTPLESQKLAQPFTQEYDLLNVDFENLLYDNFLIHII